MKVKNFPGRKLARQISAKTVDASAAPSEHQMGILPKNHTTGSPQHLGYEARGVRSKKRRSA